MSKIYCENGREVRQEIKKRFGDIPLKIQIRKIESLSIYDVNILDDRIIGKMGSKYILKQYSYFSREELDFIEFLQTTKFIVKG